MRRLDRQWAIDVVIASAWAALLSGIPSTLYAALTGGDPMEATRAAGAMLISDESSDTELLMAAGVAHVAITLFWAFILAAVLPRRRIVWWCIAAAALIAFLDVKLIAGELFPEIYALDFWPQFADHIAWGAALGLALEWRWRAGAPSSTPASPSPPAPPSSSSSPRPK